MGRRRNRPPGTARTANAWIDYGRILGRWHATRPAQHEAGPDPGEVSAATRQDGSLAMGGRLGDRLGRQCFRKLRSTPTAAANLFWLCWAGSAVRLRINNNIIDVVVAVLDHQEGRSSNYSLFRLKHFLEEFESF